MSAIRVVIVDDEPLARRGIRQLLKSHDDVELAGEARNGKEAVRVIKALTPDLVFLDVQMPELDGFEVLRRLEQPIPAVIFVTAYDSFAVRAFETHALDYLVKPVHEERFHEALSRARDRMRSNEALALSRRLSELLATSGVRVTEGSDPSRRLVINVNGSELLLDVGEIEWIGADDYYAAVYARGRRHLIRESLDSLEQRLDAQRFIRVHRSAIVSFSSVREIRSEGDGGAFIILNDGTRVPLSRRRRELVAEAIRRFAG